MAPFATASVICSCGGRESVVSQESGSQESVTVESPDAVAPTGGAVAPGRAEYRLDDLAHAAGVTVRNVRAYAERGLLPAPRRVGRVNLYDETHLARLRLINRLLERGYTVAHIADFIATWEGGHDLGQTLGLEAALLA